MSSSFACQGPNDIGLWARHDACFPVRAEKGGRQIRLMYLSSIGFGRPAVSDRGRMDHLRATDQDSLARNPGLRGDKMTGFTRDFEAFE